MQMASFGSNSVSPPSSMLSSPLVSLPVSSASSSGGLNPSLTTYSQPHYIDSVDFSTPNLGCKLTTLYCLGIKTNFSCFLVYESKEWSMKMSSGGAGSVQSNFMSSYGKQDQNSSSSQVSSTQVANTNAISAVPGSGGYSSSQYPTACKMVDEHRFSSGQQMLNLLHHGGGSGSTVNGSTTDHHSTFQYSSNGGQISSGGGSCMNEQTFAHPHHAHHSHPSHHPHPHHPHQSWSSTSFAAANSLASGRNLVADSAAAAAAAAWPHNMTSFMSANGGPSYQPGTAAYFI